MTMKLDELMENYLSSVTSEQLPRFSISEATDFILQGDAYDLFLQISNISVDLVITSPPYWGHRDYGLNHNWEFFNDILKVREIGPISPGYEWYRQQGGLLGLEPFPEWYISHLTEIFNRSLDCLKPEGNLWINMGDTYFARWSSIRDNGRQGLDNHNRFRRKTPMGSIRQEKQLLLIPSRFAIAMQEKGWILRNDLIWYKPNAMPRPKGDRLKLSHEHFFHFVKKPREGRPTYFYQPEYAETRHNDVVIVNVAPGEEGHTATFPHALIEPRILTSSPVNGIVLDPFCGTGRALEIAKKFGRSVIGFDTQAKFIEITRKKLGVFMVEQSESFESKGNFVSEWFGQRIYPMVRLDITAMTGKHFGKCPFLTNILKSATECVKGENSFGVCSISSSSNGKRQDWLVCPYRVIDSEIVKRGCARIFGVTEEVKPLPVSILKYEGELESFKKAVQENGHGYLFFQDKLGGEISVLASERSPEMSFDVTLIEIKPCNGNFEISRYGILEIQTMDFHGSYKHAVTNLRDARRLHEKDFPEALQSKPEWASKHVEGPNIANVFKRTFYQIMLKFKLSGKGAAAGTILALPQSVWDSWQPFLGAPKLIDDSENIKRFEIGKDKNIDEDLNSYICIFDIDGYHKNSISPVTISNYIKVSPEQLVHHAFTQVPSYMLHAIQSTDAILTRIKARLTEWWPDLYQEKPTKKSSRKLR